MAPLLFLDLPGEIRNQIYKELLLLLPLSTPRILGDPPIYPQILAVCRKVHEEAKQILYGCNTFLAHPYLLADMPSLRLYYDAVRHRRLRALISRYHIRVRLDCDPRFSTAEIQNAFTGVEELTVEALLGVSDYSVLKRFESVRGVKNARIYGKIYAFPEYVKWLQGAMMARIGDVVEPFDSSASGQTTTHELPDN
jgi:hypothetical protein